MAQDPNLDVAYTSLAGSSARGGAAMWFFIGNRLFLGPGHLVSVTFSGMPLYQRYHRFYFSDIASITYGPTYRQGIYFAIIALTWVGFLALFAAVGSQPFFWGASAVLSVICGVAAVINYMKGERCRFFIRTAVQSVEIPAVSTMAKAEQVVAQIIPLIQEAQELPQASGPSAASSPRPAPPSPYGSPVAEQPPPDTGQW